jgi:hypothetical protein
MDVNRGSWCNWSYVCILVTYKVLPYYCFEIMCGDMSGAKVCIDSYSCIYWTRVWSLVLVYPWANTNIPWRWREGIASQWMHKCSAQHNKSQKRGDNSTGATVWSEARWLLQNHAQTHIIQLQSGKKCSDTTTSSSTLISVQWTSLTFIYFASTTFGDKSRMTHLLTSGRLDKIF